MVAGRFSWLSLWNAGLLLAIVALPALTMGGARTWSILPTWGLVLLLLATQAGQIAFRSFGQPLRVNPVDLFAAAFIVYAFIRYLTGPTEYAARLEFFDILSYATVFWTARYGLARAGYGVFYLAGFVAVTLAVALFSFWLHLHPEFHPYGETLHLHYAPRLLGTFGCPNHYGSFLYMGVASALGLALFVERKWLARVILFYVVAVLIVGIVFSLSRGSWIGLFMVLLATTLFCVRHAGLKWYWPVGGLLVLAGMGGALLLCLPSTAGRFDEIRSYMERGDYSHYVRIQLAMDASRIIRDHFWFGTGPATFIHIHPRYQLASYSTLAIYTHDDYLNLWCDYGFIGLVLALGFIGSVTFGLLRRIDFRAPWTHRVLLCAGSAAWAGLLAHSFLDFSMHIPACAFAIFILAGLGLRRREGAPDLSGVRRRPLAWAFSAAVLIGAFFFAAGAVRTARGYYPFQEVEGQLQTISSAEAIPLLQQAALADPRFPTAAERLADFYRVDAAKQPALDDRVAPGQEAIRWYLRAIHDDPLDDGIYIHLAMAYDTLQRYNEAYFCYQRVIALQPHNGFFYNQLGLHFWQQGQIDRAMASFTQSTQCPYGGQEADAHLKELQAIKAQMQTPAPALAPAQ